MIKYLEIKIQTSSLYSEFIAELLCSCGCSGVVLSDESYIGNTPDPNMTFVKAYLAEIPENMKIIETIQKELLIQRRLLKEHGVEDALMGSWKFIQENVREDWLNAWKEFWKASKVSENIVICPTWEKFDDVSENDIIIKLDPGLVFGTGTHATTRLCIEEIEKYFKNTQNKEVQVLDVGTGSGILGIVAAKLGAKSVLGIDIDPVCEEVAFMNATINDVKERCDFKHSAIKSVEGQYDLLLVNILSRVILTIAKEIKRVTKKGGIVILSGLIESKKEDVLEAFEELDFKILNINNEDEWVAIVAQRV